MAQQFKILGSNFKNNIYKALLQADVPEQVVQEFIRKPENVKKVILEVISKKKFQKKNSAYFIKNIKHHQIMLDYCTKLNDILSTFLIGKISAAIFNTLFMAFTMITVRILYRMFTKV